MLSEFAGESSRLPLHYVRKARKVTNGTDLAFVPFRKRCGRV